jgi:zinc finger HIT domain-containing protein 3
MSPAIRAAISSSPSLPPLLRKLHKLRGSEREEALEQLLGVMTIRGAPHGQHGTSHALDSGSEEVKALKQLAEVVEKAVRGDKTDALGLDWEEGR